MLNDQQKKAIHTTEGRVLILAGAGSGKTSVLTHRIAHLIKNLNRSPSSILGLTFTNKAAAEMRKRVADMIDPSLAKQVTLCTFHSFCMQVLRKEIHKLGYTRDFTIYDERDVRRLLNHLVREELGVEGDLPSLDPTYAAISLAKNKAQAPDEMPDEMKGLPKQLFGRLQTLMRAYNAVDFDNLLCLTLQLFEEHSDILAKYQTRFRYIMIDEYQDTNPIQYKLAKLLSASHNNLCVVGDDDQAIYGWRGAEIKNILQFESETVIKLEQNYRSTPTILAAANKVIRHNQERHSKELWSSKEAGDLIEVFHAPNDLDEAAAVVYRMIAYNKNFKIPWSEMAVLYRSNQLARPIELALMQASWQSPGDKETEWRRGIPYETFGGTEFTERAEVKDLAAYLRVIVNPLDQEAILRIINVPRRGISDQALDKITQKNRDQKVPLWNVLHTVNELDGLSDRALKGIHHFVEIIEKGCEKFAHPPFDAALRWLLETINYKKAIEEEVKSDKARAYKIENVEAFVQASKNFTDLQEFLGTMALDDQPFTQQGETRDNKVSLMTFHSAKGLEFTVCFLIGLEDQIMPHEKSLLEGGLEEERRLMYVAMTRAKKNLILSMSRQRKRYGKDVNMTPSRFLFEIPKELIKVTSWKG
ncbi:MAG TPA: ATP-dependent helicase [Rhabdochlamydiaceae bacterium]|nr:ATP-dependent helicase [Rhabdochlamydiaceae bacterium]